MRNLFLLLIIFITACKSTVKDPKFPLQKVDTFTKTDLQKEFSKLDSGKVSTEKIKSIKKIVKREYRFRFSNMLDEIKAREERPTSIIDLIKHVDSSEKNFIANRYLLSDTVNGSMFYAVDYVFKDNTFLTAIGDRVGNLIAVKFAFKREKDSILYYVFHKRGNVVEQGKDPLKYYIK